MLKKSEIRCIKLLKKGPFFHEHLVYIDGIGKIQQKYRLRAMFKRSIVQNKIDEEMVLDELYIRTHIRHSFIINQVIAFQDYDTLFYMTEHAPVALLKCELLPRRFRMEAVKFYAAEIFSALYYLHSKNQIYTFLSPDNILLSADGHIKLDYAFCNGLNESEDHVLSHIEYASVGHLISNDFTRCNDYWSFGIAIQDGSWAYALRRRHPR